MPSSVQIASIVSSLDTYRTQFAALGNALTALRVVSDQMIAQLDRDREALASHIEVANDLIAQFDTSGTETSEIASPDTSAAEADVEIQASDELPAEIATDVTAEAVTDTPAGSDLTVAGETPADSIEVAAALEAEAPAATELPGEALGSVQGSLETAVETSVTAEVATETAAIVTPETDTAAQSSNETDAAVALTAAEQKADGEPETAEIKTAEVKAGDDKVVSLADRRKAKPIASPARRRAMAVVASILVTASATVGLHELMQTEMGQRIMELGTCDGNMLSATRDCGLLSWLMI